MRDMSFSICSIICSYYPNIDNLKSLSKVLSGFSTVIIVDNASNLKPYDFEEIPNIKIITPGKNLGTVKANNLVINLHPEFDYFWFWNHDTIISTDVAESFIQQSQTLFTNDKRLIATTFFDKRNWKNPLYKNRFLIKESTTLFNFKRMKAFGIEMFDEQLFLDYGDWDLSYRIQKAGGKIYQISGLTYSHSLGEPEKTILGNLYRSSELRLYLQGINFIYLIKKHGSFNFVSLLLFLRFIILPFKNLLFKNRFVRNKMFFKGILDGMKGETSLSYIESRNNLV